MYRPQEIEIRLASSHPLWGHFLWNASKCTSEYLDSHPELVKDKYVLELGAGGALPSLISATLGAKKTVITDYPDAELLKTIEWNVAHSGIPSDSLDISVKVKTLVSLYKYMCASILIHFFIDCLFFIIK